MKILVRMALAFALLLSMAPLLAGGIDRQIENTFNSMTSVSPPGVYEGQMRGVISGGSFHMRNRRMNPGSIVTLDPPSINASCGGIDLYGGALSYISKEQFVQYMRSVAASAGSYAFKLGLQTLCPTCEDIMADLQEISRLGAFNLKDSCAYGEALVAMTGLDEAATAARKKAEGKAGTALKERGWVRDALAAMHPDNGASPFEKLNEVDEETADAVIDHNPVYQTLTDLAITSWFAGGDAQILTDFMSITGTMVSCLPGTEGCPEAPGSLGQNDIKSRYVYPTLRLRDLVNGQLPLGPVLNRLRCDNTKCSSVTPVPLGPLFKGLGGRVREALIGDTAGLNTTGGFIGQYVMGLAPTQIQRALIGQGTLFTGLMIDIIKNDGERNARAFVRDFAPVVAADILAPTLTEVIDLMAADLGDKGWGPDSEVMKQIALARAGIAEDVAAFRASAQTNNVMFEVYQGHADAARGRTRNPSAPLGLPGGSAPGGG